MTVGHSSTVKAPLMEVESASASRPWPSWPSKFSKQFLCCQPSYVSDTRRPYHSILVGVAILAPVLLVGVTLGTLLPTDQHLERPFSTVSSIIGWTYFAAWTLSFYPQVWTNWRRQSVDGLSFDFTSLNFMGFVCYSIFNCTLFWDHELQDNYHNYTGSASPIVQFNDVCFGLHAVVITGVMLVQCIMAKHGAHKVSVGTAVFIGTCTLLAALFVLHVFVWDEQGKWLSWLGVVYYFSYVKMVITVIKYMPQVVLNCRRRSTVGWSVWNVLLDFLGGSLSLAQLFMTCILMQDWSPLSGNPVKVGLGCISILFDTIFIVQHYLLFPERDAGLAKYQRLPVDNLFGTAVQPPPLSCQPDVIVDIDSVDGE